MARTTMQARWEHQAATPPSMPQPQQAAAAVGLTNSPQRLMVQTAVAEVVAAEHLFHLPNHLAVPEHPDRETTAGAEILALIRFRLILAAAVVVVVLVPSVTRQAAETQLQTVAAVEPGLRTQSLELRPHTVVVAAVVVPAVVVPRQVEQAAVDEEQINQTAPPR